jgi:hypothetical protein
MSKIGGSKLVMTIFAHCCDLGHFKYFVSNHEYVVWNNINIFNVIVFAIIILSITSSKGKT